MAKRKVIRLEEILLEVKPNEKERIKLALEILYNKYKVIAHINYKGLYFVVE